MNKKLSILFVVIMIITSSITYAEIGIENNLRSYILADFETGEILEEHNIDKVIEIASISKLMTYLVVMDEVSKGRISLGDMIIIDEDITRIKGSSLELEVGERFTVKELLDAALVVSANDATYALSKYVGGTEENFATLMNEKAIQLGLVNAMFYNSTGLPIAEKGVQNLMTTREIFQLSKYIIGKHPGVLETSKKPAIEVFSRDYFQKNTNPLLREMKGVDGLKTGFTNKAGYCYVSTFNIPGRENSTEDLRLISIVMGTKGFKERNELGRVLVQYGLDNYSNKIFLGEEIPLNTIELPKGHILEVEIFPREGFSKLVKNNENIKIKIDLDEEVILPIRKGERIGRATVEEDGHLIFETDITVNEDVNKANLFVLFWRYLSDLYNRVMGNL